MGLTPSLCETAEDVAVSAKRTNLRPTARRNYSMGEYVARALWKVVWFTVWQLCWKRVYPLRPLLLRLFGARVSLRNEFDGRAWIEIPWNLEMGEYCSIGSGAHLYNLGPMTIGHRTVISRGAFLCGGTHDYSRDTLPLMKMPVVIGSDVWICAEAYIGPGATIGDGAVVGARAVAVGTIDPWTVVVGNPARFVKTREFRPLP